MVASDRLGVWGCALLAGFGSFCSLAAGQDDGSRPGIVDATAIPLERKMAFERVIVGADGVARSAAEDAGGVAGADERLIYSNTLGIHSINFPTNQPVSDDIATTAPNGCALTRYRFKVLGKVLPTGATGAYTLTYGLYTNCPLAVGSNSATRDLVRIPGTEGVLNFPDDGPRLIEHVVPAGTPVALPTNVYLSLRFNRGNCGTVVGAPASIGYSGDIWDFPGFPCNGWLGGFPELPHASFWAEFFGVDCADEFVAYKAQRPSGGTATIGANIQGVDDIGLIVNNCQVIGYEVVVRGVGFYTFDLRRECDGQVIAGTERTFQVNASTTPLLQVARFTFNPPVALTTDSLYVGFKCSSNSAGAVIAGIPPIIGSSETDYFTIGVDGCTPVLPTTGVHGAVNLAITCAGKLPLGACCDPYLTECAGGADAGKRCLANAICQGGSDNGKSCSPIAPCASPGVCEPVCAAPGTCEAVCRQTTELNCPFPPRGQEQRPTWQQGEACEPDPFLPNACGVAACCHKKPNPQNPNILDEVCENLRKNQCEAAPPLDQPREWQLGEYCGINAQSCPRNQCVHRIPYCDPISCPPTFCVPPDIFCCDRICSSGSLGEFCCTTSWEPECCQLVEELCRSGPSNDQCAPGYPDSGLSGAVLIPVPGSRMTDNRHATTHNLEPGFCCHNGTGVCIGGSNAGAVCVVGQDCASGVCSERVPNPGGQGVGTIWFKFVMPAGMTTAGIHTCSSNSPALDSILQVFAASDHSSPVAECNSLIPIACNDDFAGCASTGRNSRVCLRNLTPGETYYIMVAAKTENRRGQFIVTVTTSCSGATEVCTQCPAGDVEFIDPPDVVVDARIPHKPNGPQSPHGIRSFTVSGPPAAPDKCWSICEADPASTVQIADVIEQPFGTYRIELDKPISTASVAFLTYSDELGQTKTGRFIAHPANADGDGYADAGDIVAMVDHLNGIKLLPWGRYSGDIDRSGAVSPADILSLIDLLNGNGFAVWYGTRLPSAEGCP